MLVAILCAGFFFLAFWLIGGALAKLVKPAGESGFLEAQLIGAAAALFLASLNVLFNFPIWVLFALFASLIALNWSFPLLSLRPLQPRIRLFLEPRMTRYLLLCIPGLMYIRLFMSNLVAPGFSFRVGPDSFGWAGSAIFIATGHKLSDLATRIQGEVGLGTQVLDLIIPPPKLGLYISQIPSFTDQISAEFLIGANRLGIPGLLGSLSSLAGKNTVSYFMGGFAAWSVTILSLIILKFAISTGKRSSLTLIAIAALLPAGFPIFSMALEGGFGQLISLPFFAYMLYATLRPSVNIRLVFLSILALVTFASSSYFDVLYVAIPVGISLLLVRRLVSKDFKFRDFLEKETLVWFGLGLVALAPQMLQLGRLVSGFFLYNSGSGWHQGRIPLLSDVLGLTNWLPLGNMQAAPRTAFELAFVAFATVIAVLVFVSSRKGQMLLLVLTPPYLYLLYSVYLQGDGSNNYRLWKFGAYACVMFAFAFVSAVDFKKVSISRSKGDFTLLGYSIVLSMFFYVSSSLTWSVDYLNTRTTQLPISAAESLEPILDHFDVVLASVKMPAEYALYGDLRYGLNSRGYGLPTLRSLRARQLVVVLPKGEVCSNDCLNGFVGRKSHYQPIMKANPFFKVYLVEEALK
jgi:hypothetical protein